MIKIGLTGSIGSGKTSVARIFETLGVPVYYADLEAKRFLESDKVRDKLLARFSKDILDQKGLVSKPKLASIVFNDSISLDFLNSLIHPLVYADFSCWCDMFHMQPFVMLEAAILFETGFYKTFNRIIYVASPRELRIRRVMERDGLTEDQVSRRMTTQFSDEEANGLWDYEIVNDENCMLIPQVLKTQKEILNLV